MEIPKERRDKGYASFRKKIGRRDVVFYRSIAWEKFNPFSVYHNHKGMLFCIKTRKRMLNDRTTLASS